jgi:hypothetical protein
MRLNFYVYMCVIVLTLAFVSAQDCGCSGMPDAFWGSVKVNCEDAPVGTNITVFINGVESGSIITTIEGEYGAELGIDKLLAYGNIGTCNFGDTITFKIETSPGSGEFVDAIQTEIYDCGAVKHVNLETDCEPPIPEFSLLSGLIAVAAVGALILVIRKK